MGNFGGHALPGSFFIVFGLWWLVQIFRRYFQSLSKEGKVYKSTTTFSCPVCCGRLKYFEWEGAAKFFFSLVGGSIEIYTAYSDGQFTHLGNGQHATMFFFFGMSGLIDILMHYGVPLPKDLEYIGMTLAFMVEGLLFRFHLHGREDLDVLVHTLLLYAVYAIVAVCLLEMKFRSNPLCALARAYLLLLQGTWFWQVGFILYPPVHGMQQWDLKDHSQMMVCTMIFTWHMAAIFILMMVIGLVVGCFYRGVVKQGHGYTSLQMKLLPRDANGHALLRLHEDSESDLEFEQPLQRDTKLDPHT